MVHRLPGDSADTVAIGATGLSKRSAVLLQFAFSPEDCFLEPLQGEEKARSKSPILEVVRKAEELGLVKADKRKTLWLEKGAIVQRLILQQAREIIEPLGFRSLEIPTTFSVDDHPGIPELVDRFRRELIPVGASDSEYFRYASDPILFPLYSQKQKEVTQIYNRAYSGGMNLGMLIPCCVRGSF